MMYKSLKRGEEVLYIKRNSPKSASERMKCGREIYEHKFTVAESAIYYGVSFYTARNWLRFYKQEIKEKSDDYITKT